MKDGRTHLAHKAEHAVDLETGAVVGVTIQGAHTGDTTTIRRLVGLWGGLERVLAPFLPDLPSTASLPRYQTFQPSI